MAVALPALLVAGCSTAGSGEEKEPSADKGKSTPSAAPVKYSELPDACKTVSKDSVKKLTPKTENASGKRIGTGNAQNSGSCLWSGLDKYDYRQLTVSLKRFESDAARGSGAKLAGAFLEQQVDGLKNDKDNEDLKTEKVAGLGDQATAVTYKTDKKDGKKSEDFREQRIVVRDGNVVVSVDYSGAGFEDAKLPSEKDVAKNAEKAAKEAVAALK